MFFGNYEYQLDDKGRIVIPSKLRAELGTTVYLLKGYDGCISLYTENDFNSYIENLKNLPFEKEKARLHQRILLGSVEQLNVDKQGRLLIPLKTLKKFNITKEVVILGVLDHIEVWNREAYQNYVEVNEENFEVNAEDLLKDASEI